MRSLAELREVDETTLIFTPMGLGLDRRMTPDGSVAFLEELVGSCMLQEDVAEGTRKSFDRLRDAFVYGLLFYDLFTLVNDQALLVLEQALHERLIEFYGGTVVFEDGRGTQYPVSAPSYSPVAEFIWENNRRKKLSIILPDGSRLPFNGMLTHSLAWARKLGFLKGQRNQVVERAITQLRNSVAHSAGYHRLGPLEAARTLGDLAEIVNHLWGHATPGGRLYPAPIERGPVLLAWNADGSQFLAGGPDTSAPMFDRDDSWNFTLVMAADDPRLIADLSHFDSRYETTALPADLLWGPGTYGHAIAWLKDHPVERDRCEYLDRRFAVQFAEGRLYLPMRAARVSSLAPADRLGTWYVVTADHPFDAHRHALNAAAGGACGTDPTCGCMAETVGIGPYESIVGLLGEPGRPVPANMRTPLAYERYREVGGLS